jgi:hypothetical protein
MSLTLGLLVGMDPSKSKWGMRRTLAPSSVSSPNTSHFWDSQESGAPYLFGNKVRSGTYVWTYFQNMTS